MKDFCFREIIGKKVLILGEVGVGKTFLTARLLDEAISLGFRKNILVIDLTPTVNFDSMKNRTIKFYSSNVCLVKYIRPATIRAPRFEGRSNKHIIQLAESNAETIARQLNEVVKEHWPILFINDVTLYLQAGKIELMRRIIKNTNTCVVNAYRGEQLREDLGSGLSEHEEKALKSIVEIVDRVIELPVKKSENIKFTSLVRYDMFERE